MSHLQPLKILHINCGEKCGERGYAAKNIIPFQTINWRVEIPPSPPLPCCRVLVFLGNFILPAVFPSLFPTCALRPCGQARVTYLFRTSDGRLMQSSDLARVVFFPVFETLRDSVMAYRMNRR